MNRTHMRKVNNILCILKVPKNYSFLSLKKKINHKLNILSRNPLKKKRVEESSIKSIDSVSKKHSF